MFYVPDCRRLVDDISLILDALVSAPYNLSEYPLFSAFLLLLRRFMACLVNTLVPSHTLTLHTDNLIAPLLAFNKYLHLCATINAATTKGTLL